MRPNLEGFDTIITWIVSGAGTTITEHVLKLFDAQKGLKAGFKSFVGVEAAKIFLYIVSHLIFP